MRSLTESDAHGASIRAASDFSRPAMQMNRFSSFLRLPLVLSLVAVAACGAPPADELGAADAPPAFEGTPYGEPLTLSEVTPVSTILDDPDSWVGERVLVKGMIVEVCEKRGCWVDVASDREFEKIQIKVEDGVIVFPMSARGHEALVEGVVEALELTHDEAVEEARHRAEEQKVEFDPASVPPGPQTIYRVRGVGAVVAD